MDYVVPKIIKHFAEKQEEIELGNIHSRRDFVDVRDVARMYWTVCKSNLMPPAVNLCSGKSTSILKIINLLEEISDHKIKVNVNSKLFRKIDNDNVKGDNSIIESMGFEYQYPLKQTLSWMLENEN
jgi:nucleoside-diphosphate-sugar epimerase